MDREEIEQIAQDGESETIELKKSTAQLRRAAETLCGMLNGNGGQALIGVTPEGRIVGGRHWSMPFATATTPLSAEP